MAFTVERPNTSAENMLEYLIVSVKVWSAYEQVGFRYNDAVVSVICCSYWEGDC